jgi:hypothetical protein
MKTLLLTTAALALLAAANLSPAMAQAPKPEAQEDQSGLREILADLATGRNVSARVGLPLQIGFFNGQTALHITPEVGVDPGLSNALYMRG